jgi:hypothetical protein
MKKKYLNESSSAASSTKAAKKPNDFVFFLFFEEPKSRKTGPTALTLALFLMVLVFIRTFEIFHGRVKQFRIFFSFVTPDESVFLKRILLCAEDFEGIFTKSREC